ncbi:MAG: UDP-N-acetylmuramoyl-L-alanine--D-glutamate ligase [Chitinophagales bacterium]
MDYQGLRVLILGIARSGIAAARALVRRGAVVSIYDKKSKENLGDSLYELPIGIRILAGEEPDLQTEHYDLAVISPGIAIDSPMASRIVEQGIELIGEVELAYRLRKPGLKLIAVTGTNGKTTTTALLAEILKEAGHKSCAVGNIGVPLVSMVDKYDEGILAVEMSSFQLETIKAFHPVAAGIINITPDHLDRHYNMENYAATKARVYENMSASEYIILNKNDPWLKGLNPGCRTLYFSTEDILEQGMWVENGTIMLGIEGTKITVCPVSSLSLRGKHNLENILTAVGLAGSVGVPPEAIRRTLQTFKGVRHRLEEVRELDGVLYINDSKGTNPESTMRALESFSEPIVLIAGGRNKGSDFTQLASMISRKVKALVLVGEAKSIIREKVLGQGFSPIVETEDFAHAVKAARELAESGDVVLLSPACASWDMFNNYEERGDLFCTVVNSFQGDEG